MGWTYQDEIVYGVTITMREGGTITPYNPWINKILRTYSHLLVVKEEMSPHPGQTFIGLRSKSYILRQDSGSYDFSAPDTVGTVFAPPQHPSYFGPIECPPPTIAPEEKFLLDLFQKKLGVTPQWIRHAGVNY